MASVLLLDGWQRSALAVVRSLGRQGIPVHVADTRAPSLAGRSRYARSQLEYPDPQSSPAEFLLWVRDTACNLQVDAVFPTTDVTTMLLASPSAPALGAKLLCAPAGAYECVTDKARLVELAAHASVRVPATRIATCLEDVERHVMDGIFPLVLKPARSRVVLKDRIVSTHVYIAHSARDALDFARDQPWIGTIPCLVQEYIEGHGAGVFALYWGGKPLAWFAHRRIREKPPQGGVSVLSESVPIEPPLREAAKRVLDAAQWQGAAMVEFRIGLGGTPYLMEVNGRLWGSLQLAIDSGVDFPWLLYQAACGQRAKAVTGYAVGKRLRWFLGDVDHLLLQLRGKGIARTVGERLSAAGHFAASTFDGSARNEIFRVTDPSPAMLELRQWLKTAFGRPS